MGIVQDAEQWLVSVALKKGLVRGIQVVVAWLLAHGAAAFLSQYGAPIDATTLQNLLTAAFTGGLEVVRNWIKFKTGWTWL